MIWNCVTDCNGCLRGKPTNCRNGRKREKRTGQGSPVRLFLPNDEMSAATAVALHTARFFYIVSIGAAYTAIYNQLSVSWRNHRRANV